MASAKRGGGRSRPRIESIHSTRPGAAGREIKRADAATTIRVVGRGFGDDPAAVRALFDETEVTVFRAGFSPEELLVTCPLPAEGPTGSLRLRVGEATSDGVPFQVRRPSGDRRPPGTAIREYYEALDQIAAMTAFAARTLSSALGPDLSVEMQAAALELDGLRRLPQRGMEVLMQLRELQAGFDFEPLQTILLHDDIIARAGLTESIHRTVARNFGPGGRLAAIVGDAGVSAEAMAAGRGAGGETFMGMSPETADGLGFGLHEGAKALEGAENVIKSVKPSVEAGFSLGIELSGDVSLDPGELVSGIAKAIDWVAQILLKWASMQAGLKLDQKLAALEQKADTQGSTITTIERTTVRIQSTVNTVKQGVDALEPKADRQDGKIDALEAKADRHEGKLDRLEQKADRDTEKLDMLEQKADRHEEKLDLQEAKADRAEQKLDSLEAKADRHEEKLDRLEEKADRHEEKLDKLEGKADRLEEKSDKLETKADKAEKKLDKLESKADKAEKKLDKLESKADKAEKKLDKLEAKADKAEKKLDREEEKLDRLHPPPPHEASIADQRGGGAKVTALVAAVRGPDNEVHLRGAVDVPRSDLDDLSSWSPWIGFGKPNPNVQLTSVSIDLQYEEGSNTELDALLSARDRLGRVYHRVFEGADHSELLDPGEWSDWEDFLGSP